LNRLVEAEKALELGFQIDPQDADLRGQKEVLHKAKDLQKKPRKQKRSPKK
jgi:hypothetical protein